MKLVSLLGFVAVAHAWGWSANVDLDDCQDLFNAKVQKKYFKSFGAAMLEMVDRDPEPSTGRISPVGTTLKAPHGDGSRLTVSCEKCTDSGELWDYLKKLWDNAVHSKCKWNSLVSNEGGCECELTYHPAQKPSF